MKDIETVLVNRPDGRTTIMHNFNPSMVSSYMEFSFIDKVNHLMAEKMVKEIWKKHGASLLKKVDKKTIGNLTVKKLTALIAKELTIKQDD